MNEKTGINKQLDEARIKAVDLTDEVEKIEGEDSALVKLGDELVDLLGGCLGAPRRRH